jgi:hypothetical protein
MAPLLVTPPVKTETKRTATAVLEIEIAPLLTSPPEKVPTSGLVLVVAPARKPRWPESTPALEMPPAEVEDSIGRANEQVACPSRVVSVRSPNIADTSVHTPTADVKASGGERCEVPNA